MKLTMRRFWRAAAAFGGVGVVLGGEVIYQQHVVHSKDKTDILSQKEGSDDNGIWRQGRNITWSWDSNWDKRDPEHRLLSRRYKSRITKSRSGTNDELGKQDYKIGPTASRNIFLIRHGQYDQAQFVDSKRKLTELGKRQAEATGIRLKLVMKGFTRYIVSDMTRALETAEIIGEQLSPNKNSITSFERDPLLSEGAPIQPEPPNRWHPMLHYYNDGMRIEAAFRKYFHRADSEQANDSYEVIVCHANVIRYFCCRALQFPPERWLRMSLANGSITHIQIDCNGEVTLFCMGDSSHLPPELVTTK